MKRVLRVLAILLGVCLLMQLAGVSTAYARLSEPPSETVMGVGGSCGSSLYWALDSDGKLTISGTGSMNDCASTSDVPWYSYRDSITSVYFENGAVNVGGFAFYGCKNLVSADLSSCLTLKTIDHHSFYLSTQLSTVKLPASLTGIGQLAFALTAITVFNFPAALASIGTQAFRNCQQLTAFTVDASNTKFSAAGGVLFDKNVTTLYYYPPASTIEEYTIPSTVKTVSQAAFYNCANIVRLNIPASVTSIGSEQFVGCSSLKSFSVDSANTFYSSSDGVLFDAKNSTLLYFPAAGSFGDYVVPNGTVTIAGAAAEDCKGLSSIAIPDSVSTIEASAFSGCTNLSSVNFPQSSAGSVSIKDYAFEDCTALVSAVVPDNTKTIGISAFSGCKALTDFAFPSSATSISANTFINCSSLANVSFTASSALTSIAGAAFSNCSSLSSIDIPDGVTQIGARTFSSCTRLASVRLPSSLDSIGNRAFDGCRSLTEVTIPSTVTQLGSSVFYQCVNLYSVVFMGSVPTVGDDGVYVDCSAYLATYYLESNASSWAPNGETAWQGNPLRLYGLISDLGVSDCAYAIIVKNTNGQTLSGCGVTIGSTTVTTDSQGVAAFSTMPSGALTVKLSGYSSYKDSGYSVNDMGADVIILSSDTPHISALSCNGSNISTAYATVNCSDGGSTTITLSSSESMGVTYALVQNGAVVAESTTPSFTLSNSLFIPDVPVYAVMKQSVLGNEYSLKLNIRIVNADFARLFWNTGTTQVFQLTDTNGNAVGELYLESRDTPLSYYIRDDRLYIGIGLDEAELKANALSLSPYCSGKLSAISAGDSVSASLCGWLEYVLGDDIRLVASGIYLAASFDSTSRRVIELDPCSLNVKLSRNAASSVTSFGLSVSDSLKPLSGSGSLSVTGVDKTCPAPEISSLFDLHRYGEVGYTLSLKNLPELETSASVSIDLLFRGRVGFVAYKAANSADASAELSVVGGDSPANVQLISYGSDTLAVWLAGTSLRCAIRRGGSDTFSASSAALPAGVACGDFELISYNDRVYIAYLEASVELGSNVSEALSSALVKVAGFDGVSFTDALSVTAEAGVYLFPRLVAAGGALYALWYEHGSDSLFSAGSGGAIYYSKLIDGAFGESVLLYYGLPLVTSLAACVQNDKPSALFSCDSDGDLSTSFDSRVYLADGSALMVKASGALGSVVSNGSASAWTDGQVLYYLASPDASAFELCEVSVLRQLCFTHDGSLLVCDDSGVRILNADNEFELLYRTENGVYIDDCAYLAQGGLAVILTSLDSQSMTVSSKLSLGAALQAAQDVYATETSVAEALPDFSVRTLQYDDGDDRLWILLTNSGEADGIALIRVLTQSGSFVYQFNAGTVQAGSSKLLSFRLHSGAVSSVNLNELSIAVIGKDATPSNNRIYTVICRSDKSALYPSVTAPTLESSWLHGQVGSSVSLAYTENGCSFSSIDGLTRGSDYSAANGVITILGGKTSALGEGLHELVINFEGFSRTVTLELAVPDEDTLTAGQIGTVVYDGKPVERGLDFYVIGVANSEYTYTYTKGGAVTEGLPTDAGSYVITVTRQAMTLRGEASVSFELVINKAKRHVAAPKVADYDDSSVTLSAAAPLIVTDRDTILYGISEKAANAEISWQSDVIFDGLDPAHIYRFYAKVGGDPNYEDAVSLYTAVLTDKLGADAPVAPIAQNRTDVSVTLMEIVGMEYSMDGVNYFGSPVFIGLEPNTEYGFYMRRAETETSYASAASECSHIYTLRSEREAPAVPELLYMDCDRVELVVKEGTEYRVNDGAWQESGVFTGLLGGAEYLFYARYMQDETYYASAASEALCVTTNGDAPDKPTAPVASAVTDTSVTLFAVSGYEYSQDDGAWQSSNVFTGLEAGSVHSYRQRAVKDGLYSDTSDEISVTLDKAAGAVASAPVVLSMDSSRVVLKSYSGMEYRVGVSAWQSSNLFTGLCANTEYSFTQRYKETAAKEAGAASEPTTLTTSAQLPDAPNAPIAAEIGSDRISLVMVDGYEYACNGVWQSSPSFTGLSPATEYSFMQRDAEWGVSSTEARCSTVKTSGSTVNAPEAASTDAFSVTLKAVDGCEYRVGEGVWQSSNVFNMLSPATSYSFYARYTETDTSYAGESSEALTVVTLDGQSDTPMPPAFAAITNNSVTLVAVDGYEYSKDGASWQSLTQFSGLSAATEYSFFQRDASAPDVVSASASCTTDKNSRGGSARSVQTDSVSFSSVTLVTVSGYEYRLGDGSWQDSPEFTGLEAGTSYSFTQRRAETDSFYAGSVSDALIVTTSITVGSSVSAPIAAEIGPDFIRLVAVYGCEYRISGGEWQGAPEFAGLEANTSYTLEQRMKQSPKSTAGAPASAAFTTEKYEREAPQAPTLDSAHGDSITLVAADGYEYRIGDGVWQGEAVFGGLAPETEYSFFVRYAETDEYMASESSEALSVLTGIAAFGQAEAPQQKSRSARNITLIAIDGLEYSIDGGEWQSSPSFSKLAPGTKYSFRARYAADGKREAGEASEASVISTDKFAPSSPDAPEISAITDSSVTLRSNIGYEYRIGDGEWQSSPSFTGLMEGVEYAFYQRTAESTQLYASPASPPNYVTPGKEVGPDAPSAPVLESKTSTSVTLTAIEGMEYSLDKQNWQSSPVFNGLTPNTEYSFYQRCAETEITEAGAVSEALTIVTDAQEQSIRYGDANCDGKVNASDASYILRSLVGLDSLSAQGYKNANVDGQSGVSAADASCILRYLVGLLPSLPAE